MKLADHLDRGKLFHDKFDYEITSKDTGCGTAGCALGEAWVIWGDGKAGAVGFGILKARILAENLFGIEHPDITYLFMGGGLPLSSTKEQVAAHIRFFVEKKCRECGIAVPYSTKNQARLTSHEYEEEPMYADAVGNK